MGRLGGVLGRVPNRFSRRRRPYQRRFHAPGADRDRAHVGQRHFRLGDRAVLGPDRGRDRDDRPGLRDPVELLVVRTPIRCAWSLWPEQDLVRGQGGGEEVDEELARRDRAASTRARDEQFGVQGQHRGEQVTGRVGVRDAPPNVPRCRICGSATVDVASASNRACVRTNSSRCTS